MKKITKYNLPDLIFHALSEAKLDHKDFPNLALSILQSSAIELDTVASIAPPNYLEMVVVGLTSGQGTRTSGRHVNIFALAGVIISAATAKPEFPSLLGLLVALLGACTITLAPEQAAFFIASKELKESNIIPTAKAVASQIGMYLNDASYSIESTITVAKQLRQIGVEVSIGELPNQIVRYTESAVFFKGL